MTMKTLRKGSRGELVVTLQTALIRAAASDERDCLSVPFPEGKVFETDGDFGRITKQAVEAYQKQEKREDPDFEVDGIVGNATWTALGFTTGRPNSPENKGAAKPSPLPNPMAAQGRVPGQGRKAGSVPGYIAPPAGSEMPPWMTVAWREHSRDIYERYGGDRNNPRIIEYMSLAKGMRYVYMSEDRRNQNRIRAGAAKRDERRIAKGKEAKWLKSFEGKNMAEIDENPWCGCFVQWCLYQAGYPLRKSFTGAKNWKPLGSYEMAEPKYGAVCVTKWKKGGHHVGFVAEVLPRGVRMLGGNQKDVLHGSGGAVSVRKYTEAAEYWYLWPTWPCGT